MFALAVALLIQSDEADGIKVCEAYFQAMKKADFEAAADCMHSQSLKKLRQATIGGLESRTDEEKARVATFFGFAGWKELAAAGDRTFFVAFCKNMNKMDSSVQDMVANSEARIMGSTKREGRVYVIVELTFKERGEGQTLEALYVLYRDGEKWRLANPGERNIGK